jgi:hypothetical protein
MGRSVSTNLFTAEVTKMKDQFMNDAVLFMKTDVELYIYELREGSILSFPANICYHMTLTPQNYMTNNPYVTARDILIIYPTVPG